MESEVGGLSNRVVALERSILGSQRRDDEALESMFRARHELVTVQTMASHDRSIFERLTRVAGDLLDEDGHRLVEDMVDQFGRVQGMCATERDFLQELLDLYQTRATDSINLAMERLALITAVALPITAVASVYGMNTIVNVGHATGSAGGIAGRDGPAGGGDAGVGAAAGVVVGVIRSRALLLLGRGDLCEERPLGGA